MDERVAAAEPIDEVDVGELLRVLWKWRWLWAGIAALAVATAAVLSFFVLPPVYRAEMTLMVVNALPNDAQRRPVVEDPSLERVVDPLNYLPQLTIKTYVAQVTNPQLLLRVRDRLGLDRQLYDERTLAGMVKAEQIRDTNLIRVSVEHTDPVLARRIAETLADEFFKLLEENVTQQLERSVRLLDSQIEVARKDLEAAIAAWNKARSKPRSAALLEQEYETKRKLLEESRANLLNREVQVATLKRTVAQLDAELARTPATVTVEETSTDASGGKTRTTRREPNPAYQSLLQLRQERMAELAQARAEADALAAQVEGLQGEVQRLQAELVKVKAEEEALARRVEHLEQTYNLLNQKRAETKALRAGNLGEASVLLAAPPLTPQDPVRPRKGLNMALAGVLGLVLGFIVTFIAERFDNTVKTPEDVERLIGAPVLGEVPFFGRGLP